MNSTKNYCKYCGRALVSEPTGFYDSITGIPEFSGVCPRRMCLSNDGDEKVMLIIFGIVIFSAVAFIVGHRMGWWF